MPKLLACLLILVAFPALALERAQGWCEQGAKTVTVGGQVSASNTPIMRSYPSCTVTVYITGSGGTLATLYSTNSMVALANPFSADKTGYWTFFAADNNYDIQFSGGGIPTPFTQGAHSLIDTYYDSAVNGYVARTKNAKLADIQSVKDLGAVGDGTVDDTAALQQAFTNTRLNKCIFFPDGVYTTTQALVSTHQVCLTGQNWRIKYTGSSTIAAVVSLIGGGATNPHGSFMEGSNITGMIIDGQGKATLGLLLQAVVSGWMNFIRVTNVIDAGVMLNWAQQVAFDHLMVSTNFEAFTTTPRRGLVIDGISSANSFYQINIEHVSTIGIDLQYAFNTVFYGGTSEGNGTLGVNCSGAVSPFRQCLNNQFINLDTEVNGTGDYMFTTQAFANTIIDANSFSIPGIQFTGQAHHNTVVGGLIGGGSVGGAQSFGNRLINVITLNTEGGPDWTDNGANYNDAIYNAFSNVITDPADNNHLKSTWSYQGAGPVTRTIEFNTPSPGLDVDVTVGKQTDNWIGIDALDGFPVGYLMYNVAGMRFVGATTHSPLVDAIPDGSISNHNWGFGTFNITPSYPFHFFSGSISTVAIQSGGGQGTADQMKFLDHGGSRMGGVTYQGAWDGPISGGVVGQALCKKSDSTIGQCTTVVSSSGSCTCN